MCLVELSRVIHTVAVCECACVCDVLPCVHHIRIHRMKHTAADDDSRELYFYEEDREMLSREESTCAVFLMMRV